MAAKKRNALGRGLSALLEDSETISISSKSSQSISSASNFYDVPLENIETNPFQPRTDFDETALNELADSIKTQGIIQPVTVRKLGKDKFQLISGERRFQASKKAGLEKIPAYIRTADDQQMLEMAIIENIQRENLNAIEVAISYQRLLSECDLKQEQLGERLGKDRTTVNNYLRLLKLPPAIQAAVRDKKISMGHARTLISIDNVDTQLAIFNKIIKEDLSVRKAEALVKEHSGNSSSKKSTKAPVKNVSPEMQNLQYKLSSHFGTKITIKSESNDKGEIKIPYVSVEDLNRILEILEV